MKKGIMLLCVAALMAPMSALAGVNVNVNLGLPIPVPMPPPPPRVVLPPPPPVLFERPPLFLAPPSLGIYVGVDVPYDIVYAEDAYYLNYRNGWYRSGSYNGPWVGVRQERLPLVVRRQGLEYIRVHRDREFQNYRRDQNHYRGRQFWAGREVREIRREDRRDDRRDWKEERKRDKQEWKEERKRDKEELKYERKRDKEEWKDHDRR
ncbi:MAG: hypothetical protein HXX11_02125 [Desulfuromonadales bacterium]|nr:hypothetical protein [Desulfuromonadales bacterium]